MTQSTGDAAGRRPATERDPEVFSEAPAGPGGRARHAPVPSAASQTSTEPTPSAPCATSHHLFDATTNAFCTGADVARGRAPLRWHQALASYGPRRDLARHARRSTNSAAWDEKQAFFAAHVAQLTGWQSAQWLGRQLWDTLCLPRAWVAGLLFPAKHFPAVEVQAQALDRLTKYGLQATPQTVVTADHAVLDGLRLAWPQHAAAPGLLVCLGNGMQFGDGMVDWLSALSLATMRPVYVYNYRGIGHSAGTLRSTGDAVADSAAALRRVMAAEANASPQHVGVLGISIGAGCAAGAVAKLKREGHCPKTGVGQFVSVHSFRSLTAVLAQFLGRIGTYVAARLLALLGQDPLDTQKAAEGGALGTYMAAVNAHGDRLIGRKAALTRFRTDRNGKGAGLKSALFADVGQGHCDIGALLRVKPLLTALQPSVKP